MPLLPINVLKPAFKEAAPEGLISLVLTGSAIDVAGYMVRRAVKVTVTRCQLPSENGGFSSTSRRVPPTAL